MNFRSPITAGGLTAAVHPLSDCSDEGLPTETPHKSNWVQPLVRRHADYLVRLPWKQWLAFANCLFDSLLL